MKKKLIAILTVVVLAVSVLTGCGASFSKVKMREGFKQADYDYVVYSNGGNAVQYGEYVYFINGTKGYEDTDAKQNVWGKVVKGALYRAKLEGTKNTAGRKWDIKTNPATEMEFVTYRGNDYLDQLAFDEEEIDSAELDSRKKDIVDVDVVAPKVIGTSGYAAGGIFIYDDFVYYATPNNKKDKSGKTLVTYTDFMRTRLDGSLTQLIFTTEADSADKPYGFFKQGDAVYLVCHYGTNLVSVKMPSKNTKVEKAMLISDKAVSVVMKVSETYDSKNNTAIDAEDFIYFTRAIEEGDKLQGNVVEVINPDGSENFELLSDGKTYTLDSVNSGGLFYHYEDSMGSTEVMFTNLHNQLMVNSPSYKAYDDTLLEDSEDQTKSKRIHFDASLPSFTSTAFATFKKPYYFRTSNFSNEVYMLAFSDKDVYFYSSLSGKKILAQAAEMHFIDGDYLYYNISGSTAIYRTQYDKAVGEAGKTEVQVSSDTVVTSGLKADYIPAGYIVYFSAIDEYADAYPLFRKVANEGFEDIQVFKRSPDDVKPDTEE